MQQVPDCPEQKASDNADSQRWRLVLDFWGSLSRCSSRGHGEMWGKNMLGKTKRKRVDDDGLNLCKLMCFV